MSTPNETTALAVQKREITAAHAAELGLPSPEAINYMTNISKLILNSALITGDMICGTCQGKGQVWNRSSNGYIECRDCNGEFDERKVQANAMAKMLVGHEMGIPAIQALQEIDIVKGRIFVRYPQLLSQMMRKGFKLDWVERSNTKAALKVTPPSDYPMEEEVFEFTMLDANTAGLGDSDQYKKRPRIMLASRVISEAYRATGGQSNVYTPEEREEIVRGDSDRVPPKKDQNPYMATAETPQPNDNPTQQSQQGNKGTAKDEGKAEPEAPANHAKGTSAPSTSPAVPPEQAVPQPTREATPPSPASTPTAESPRNMTGPTTAAAGGPVSVPSTKFELLNAFAEQKKRIGDAIYYQILGTYGVEKSDQFRTLGEAKRALAEMQEFDVPVPNSYAAKDDDLPKEITTPGAAAATTPKAEVVAAMEAMSLMYEKKSPDAVKKGLSAFVKGFYGGKEVKPDAANIEAIRLTLRILKQIMVDYTHLIVETPKKAETAGITVSAGVHECAKYLEGRSPEAKAEFWKMAVDRYPDSGGKDWFDTALVPNPGMPDVDFIVFMRLLQRKLTGVADFLEHIQKHGLSMAEVVKGWAVDITTAPEAGLVSLMAGEVKNPPAAPTPAPGPVLVPSPAAPSADGEEDLGWLFDKE